eukprot:COSAG02_NODE_17175_length_1023_cov_1.291126_2_plen_109_part_00
MSSMSYSGPTRSSASSVRSGSGGGTSSRNSDGSNKPSSSTEVAHRMIMHVLRSQYALGCALSTEKEILSLDQDCLHRLLTRNIAGVCVTNRMRKDGVVKRTLKDKDVR